MCGVGGRERGEGAGGHSKSGGGGGCIPLSPRHSPIITHPSSHPVFAYFVKKMCQLLQYIAFSTKNVHFCQVVFFLKKYFIVKRKFREISLEFRENFAKSIGNFAKILRKSMILFSQNSK